MRIVRAAKRKISLQGNGIAERALMLKNLGLSNYGIAESMDIPVDSVRVLLKYVR